MSSKSGYIELLKDEHIQMHAKLIELQRRYDILEASILKGNEEREFSKGSFIHRVVSAIANLYKNGLYRYILFEITVFIFPIITLIFYLESQ